jgi:hypothetical protein
LYGEDHVILSCENKTVGTISNEATLGNGSHVVLKTFPLSDNLPQINLEGGANWENQWMPSFEVARPCPEIVVHLFEAVA